MNQYTKDQRNDCDTCQILDYTTCPLFERAVERGLEGVAECEMCVSIRRLIAEVKKYATWGPKKQEEVTA
jgi:hypothetical protein